MGRDGHLRERQAAGAPGDDVAGAGDVDFRRVFFPLDRAGLKNLEEFRVERSPEQLKRQFRDFRPSNKHVDVSFTSSHLPYYIPDSDRAKSNLRGSVESRSHLPGGT